MDYQLVNVVTKLIKIHRSNSLRCSKMTRRDQKMTPNEISKRSNKPEETRRHQKIEKDTRRDEKRQVGTLVELLCQFHDTKCPNIIHCNDQCMHVTKQNSNRYFVHWWMHTHVACTRIVNYMWCVSSQSSHMPCSKCMAQVQCTL